MRRFRKSGEFLTCCLGSCAAIVVLIAVCAGAAFYFLRSGSESPQPQPTAVATAQPAESSATPAPEETPSKALEELIAERQEDILEASAREMVYTIKPEELDYVRGQARAEDEKAAVLCLTLLVNQKMEPELVERQALRLAVTAGRKAAVKGLWILARKQEQMAPLEDSTLKELAQGFDRFTGGDPYELAELLGLFKGAQEKQKELVVASVLDHNQAVLETLQASKDQLMVGLVVPRMMELLALSSDRERAVEAVKALQAYGKGAFDSQAEEALNRLAP